jgi:hypothetical protein
MQVTEIARATKADPALVKQGEETMTRILTRSATDPEFRRKLISDPKAAVAEFTHRDVAQFAGFNVVFVENKVDATVVLPDAIDPEAELSEDELEAVAGGLTPLIPSILSIIASAIALTRAIAE